MKNQYIGGNRQNGKQIHERLEAAREVGAIVQVTPRWWMQCRCGNCDEWLLYRGRWYCAGCGRTKYELPKLATGEWILGHTEEQREVWAEIQAAIATVRK